MATRSAPWKKPDTTALRAQLSQLIDQGQHDTLLQTVIALVEQMASQNDRLAWRLQTALSQLYRRKSEKISPEQLSLFLSKLGQKAEQANVDAVQAQNAPEAEKTSSLSAPPTPAPSAASVAGRVSGWPPIPWPVALLRACGCHRTGTSGEARRCAASA